MKKLIFVSIFASLFFAGCEGASPATQKIIVAKEQSASTEQSGTITNSIRFEYYLFVAELTASESNSADLDTYKSRAVRYSVTPLSFFDYVVGDKFPD